MSDESSSEILESIRSIHEDFQTDAETAFDQYAADLNAYFDRILEQSNRGVFKVGWWTLALVVAGVACGIGVVVLLRAVF